MTRYWAMTIAGLALCGGAVVAFDSGLYNLVHTGTCASGGPYVSARPCPPGTGWHVAALVGGIFAGLIGLAVYAGRGGKGRPSPVPLGAIMWALLFCSIAGVSIVAAFGPANNGDDGVRVMAVVFGFVFIPMGLAPVVLSPMARGTAERVAKLAESESEVSFDVVPKPAASPTPSAAPAPSEQSLFDKLQRLGELRDSGVLTEEEFEQQKRKLLGG